MTILFATGFEMDSNLADISVISNSGTTVNSSLAHTGSYSALLRSDSYTYVSPTAENELVLSCWVRLDSGNWDDKAFITFTLENGDTIHLEIDSSEYIALDIDNVKVATAVVSPVIYDTWINFQVRVVIDDVTGIVQVKKDGALIIDYSGDTQPGTAPNDIASITMTSPGNFDLRLDDMVISDTFIGDIRIEALVPDADTATLDWTPSTGGDNYALVDEIPENDSDYVTSTTDGDQDLYDIEDWDDTGKTPVGVVLWHYAKADVATGQSIKQLANSGATLDESAEKLLSTDWNYFFHLMENDPNTAAAWTDAAIDALEIGQESVI